MAKRRKLRKCRICKKSPVWRGGDVKNPGPYCKKCYHKHVWINRPGAREEESLADAYVDYLSGILPEAPYDFDERLFESPEFFVETLPEPPRYRYPDEADWAWICHMYRDKFDNRPEWDEPLEPHPDEADWAWICRTFLGRVTASADGTTWLFVNQCAIIPGWIPLSRSKPDPTAPTTQCRRSRFSRWRRA